MTWVKLDDGFFRNRKALAVGKDGRAMYVAGLCYCAAGLTDGKIIAPSLRIIAADADVPTETVDELVAVGLWERLDDGYAVPDYLSFNPSRQQVIAERERAKSRQKSRRDNQRDDDGSSDAPSSSRPSGSKSSPSLSSSSDPASEATIETALGLFADRKLASANGSVTRPGPWKRKVLENARAELAPMARDWLDRFDVSPSQLADGLLQGTVPASWGPYRRPTGGDAA